MITIISDITATNTIKILHDVSKVICVNVAIIGYMRDTEQQNFILDTRMSKVDIFVSDDRKTITIKGD